MKKFLLLSILLVSGPAFAQVGDGGFMNNNAQFVGTPKADIVPPVGNPINQVRAVDINQMGNASYDIRTWLYKPRPLQQFGAACDGGYDDTLALVNAVRSCDGGVSCTIQITGGTCRIANSVTVPAGITLDFTDIGMLSIDTGKILTINGMVQAPQNKQIFVPATTGPNDQAPVQFGTWVGTYGYLPGTITQVYRVYPQWWGTPADGGADDAPYIQMAINSLGYTPDGGSVSIPGSGIGSGGEVFLTAATYRINEPLAFGVEQSGMSFTGVGQVTGFDGTTIYCFTQNGLPCLQFGNTGFFDAGLGVGPEQMIVRNFNIVAEPDAGPVIKWGQGGSTDFYNIRMVEFNPGANAIEMIANPTIGNQIELISYRQVVISLTTNYTGAAIYMEAHDGFDVSELRFEDILVNGYPDSPHHDAGEGTSWQVWMQEDSAGGVGCANISFDKLRMEEPAGGGILNAGCRNVVVRNSIDADLQNPLAWHPLIELREGGDGGTPFLNSIPNFMLFENDQFFDGTNQFPCFKTFCGPGFVAPVLVNVSCYGPIEVGACQNPMLISSGFNSGLSDGGGGGGHDALPFTIFNGGFTGVNGLSSSTVQPNNLTGPTCELFAGQSIATCTANISSIPENDDKYKILLQEVATNTDAGFEDLGQVRVINQPGDGGLGDGASRQFQIQASVTATFNHFFNWLLYR